MTTAPAPTAAAPTRRALVAGSVGNFVEWYEFGVYGYFATVIAANFFTPSGGSSLEGLVKTYAAFALAFFFRPAGAALFGRAGDRLGRRPVLVLVLLVMTAATTLIGALPTYATAGAAAPWLLTLLRVVQGLCAGGEFGGAVAVLTEFAPVGRRGLYGAWQSFTVGLGLVAGAGLAALLAAVLDEAALTGWGWRLPFLLTLPLGLAALWVRLKLDETPNFAQVQAAESPGHGPKSRTLPASSPEAPQAAGPTPVADSQRGGESADERANGPTTGEPPTSTATPRRPGAAETLKAILLGAGRLTGWAAAGYTFLVVLPSYLQSTLDAGLQQALAATALANVGFAAAVLPAGWLSDRVGRRTVMLTGSVLTVVFALPLLHLLQDPHSATLARGAAVFAAGAVVGLLAGPGPAMLAEMFPTRVRYTGLGLAYALSNAVFSGCAGLFITELVNRTGDADIPAYYAAAACAVSIPALLTLRGDDHRRALRD